MDFFLHQGVYDAGHLIYDLWLIIIIFLMSIISTFLVAKGILKQIDGNKLCTEITISSVVAIVLVNFHSLQGKIILLAPIVLILTFWAYKKDQSNWLVRLIILIIGGLYGFGLNIVPLVLAAVVWGLAKYLLRNKQVVG